MDKCQYRHWSYKAFVFRGICLLTGGSHEGGVMASTATSTCAQDSTSSTAKHSTQQLWQ